MRAKHTHLHRPWVAPEVCPEAAWAPGFSSDLRRAIDRAERALAQRSIGKIIHALLAIRAALRSRLTDPTALAGQAAAVGPWPRRLRRRYAASLCSIERLVENGWSSCDFDALSADVRQQLDRLRRLESLESRAHLEQHWTDIGVGD